MLRSLYRHAAREASLTRVFEGIRRVRAYRRARLIRGLAGRELEPADVAGHLLDSIRRKAWFLRHLLQPELDLARVGGEEARWSLECLLALRSLRRARLMIAQWVNEDREDVRLALLESAHDNEMLEAVDLTMTGTASYLADIASAPKF